MKKILFFIITVLLSIQIQGQSDKTSIPNPTKAGSTYYICIDKTEILTPPDNQLILKITYPQWAVEKIDTVTTPVLPKGKTVSMSVEIRPAAIKWRISVGECLFTDSTDCLGLFSMYERARSKTFHSTKEQSHNVVEIEKLTRPASLSLIAADSLHFDSLQKIELEKTPPFTYFKDTIEQIVYIIPNSGHSFYWDKDKPYTHCSTPVKLNTVRQVQQKLNEKGYDCPVSNIMCQKTKDALVRFQKDNAIANNCIGGNDVIRALLPPPPPTPPSEEDLKLKSLNEW